MHDEYSVINKIRRVSNSSNSRHIRSKIIDPIELQSLGELLKLQENGYSSVMDVSVQNIISLNRIDDTWFKGDTWLDALNNRLHGKGWKEEVFDYYEKEIDAKDFPAPGAREYLQLNSYNGLIGCGNGNHRLIAGLCWMASKYGDTQAILKKVHVHMILFDENRVLVLKELYKSYDCGIKIFKNELTNSEKDLYETKEDRILMIDEKLYEVSNKDYKLLFELKESLLDKLFRFLNPKKRKNMKIAKIIQYTVINIGIIFHIIRYRNYSNKNIYYA